MTTAEKIISVLVLLIVITPGNSLGEDLDLGIYANTDDLEIKMDWEFPHHINNPEIGAGLIYNDDYLISDFYVSLKEKAFVRNMTFGLGFKGLMGEVETLNRDYNLRAISFLLLGQYELERKSLGLPIDVCLSFSIAPDPLCASDTDRYLEFSSTGYLHVMRNAAIGIEYRAFKVRFDEFSGNVKASDDAILLGFKLEF